MTKTTFPPINVKSTLETEALRLLFTAKKLATHQYQAFEYLILPEPITPSPSNLVVFPKLNLTQHPNFWEQSKSITLATPPNVQPRLLKEIVNLLKLNQCSPPSIKTPSSNLTESFFTDLSSITPLVKNISKINLYPTKIGSISSFSLLLPTIKEINIYLRNDQPLSTFFEKIISSITREKLQEHYRFNWRETEAAKDSLIFNTKLIKYFPHYRSVITDTRNLQAGLLKQQSQKYLKSLGLTTSQPWIIKDNKIYHQKTHIKNISDQEKKLLTLLVNHYHQTITFDQIFNHLWPNNYDISISAISKLIERLRNTLEKNSLPKKYIQTKRKQGYLLTSFFSEHPAIEKQF